MLCIKNKYSTKRPLYIGNQYPLRLNVVLGISNESQDIFPLIDDAIEIVEHGADCIQDVSICGKINEFKKRLVSEVAAPCGSVLAYEFAYNVDKYKLSKLMDIRDLLLDLVTKDAEMGMDFLTLHSSLSLKLLSMQFDNRIIYMGSRGSSLLYKMMNRLNIDNPLHLYYEDIIEVMKKYNMAVSLGSAFRSCSILDYSYKSMNEELAIQSELSTIAHAQDLPVLLEGISHIPISKLLEYVTLVNEKCPGVEVTALGPSPTDVGVGIDHIAGAIAAERAAESGFTLLTIVTGKEHYSLPSREDVLEALNAYKLAVYISNLHKGYLPIMDKRVSIARNNLEW
ncbi:MAG: phosphomethylpyrimidine synthase ThiC, partial [Candidatus Sabulitectum sp.]|nr:phosphomethylpyrimidine synthase ThiC [Candidatus Sabulitectum sp.]